MSRADYEREIVKVYNAVQSRDLNLLAAAGDEVEKTWGAAGGEQYGHFMAEVSSCVATDFDNFSLSQEYATLALTHADTFSVRLDASARFFDARFKCGGVRRSVGKRKERQGKAMVACVATA